MRRRWKIALAAVGGLVVLAGGGFLWLMLRPAAPVEIVAPGPTGRRIDDGKVFGNFFPSPVPGRRPAVLILGGSEGGLGRDVRAEALLLQRAGFSVLHVGYFNVPGRSSKLYHIPLETFYDGLDWLKRQPEIDGASLGIVGYSKGAEAALLVAAHYRGLKAVVAGMPSSVAWAALSIRGFVFGSSSWTMGGKPIPSLSYGSGDGKRELLPRFVNALNTLDRHRDAIIPAERVTGTLLLICGERDTLWPSCPMARQIMHRLEAAGRPAPQLLAYSDAGHGVMGAPLPPDNRDLKKWTVLGGTPEANAAARADGWPRIETFLARALRPAGDAVASRRAMPDAASSAPDAAGRASTALIE